MSVALRLEEAAVCRSRFGDFLRCDGLLDLIVLVQNQFVISVTVGVVFAENVEGLFFTAFADEPSDTFGSPPDEGELEDTWKGLYQLFRGYALDIHKVTSIHAGDVLNQLTQGSRQHQSVAMLRVPKVSQAAMIEPTYQQVLIKAVACGLSIV